MNKPTTFVDYLKEIHAAEYMGTDDDMPDAFDAWVDDLGTSEVMAYAENAMKLAYIEGIKRGGDIAVQTLRA